MEITNLLQEDIIGHIGVQKYACKILWRNGQLEMDEPIKVGGRDTGPDPYTVLLASLAGCTLSTLRMYIDRKGWEVPEISISLNMSQINQEGLITNISRSIDFHKDLSDEIKDRLLLIAEKCPVSKILENKIVIDTKLKANES